MVKTYSWIGVFRIYSLERGCVMFKDRQEAGEKLARELAGKNISDGVIMAIPRGGVVLAAVLAKNLKLPVDVIIPRKIGAPFNPEMAVGAVTQDGAVIYDHNILGLLGLREDDLQSTVEEQIKEIERRMMHYRGSTDYPNYTGKEIILVDDGVATGSTTIAAIKSLYNMFEPKRLILAVPVGPPEVMNKLKKEVDETICLIEPEFFNAVGQFYQNFEQVEDEEVIQLLKQCGQ